MPSEQRRTWEREYKRRKYADPEWRAAKLAKERERYRNNPTLRERRQARGRERWAKSDNSEKNQRRIEQKSRQQQFDELWREKSQKWQSDYFKRHYGNDEWRQRRDLHRVRSYYGVDDPALIEALALARAAKRKMRT